MIARLTLAFAASLAAGCATLVPQHPPGDPVAWDARRAALTARLDWTLEGRVAIADADRGYSGALDWDQHDQVFDARFVGPLGSGSLRIHGDATGLVVSTSKGESFAVTDPERELEARLGWSMPLHSMRYWLLGVPDPGSAFDADYDAAGRPRHIAQRGWSVRYETWHAGDPLALPRKLTLERDDLRIRVVAERWTP